MLLSGFCLTLWAWCLLSLGLERHQRTVLATPWSPAQRRAARSGGWALLALALAVFVGWRGWELGPVLGASALMLAALAWVLLMTLLPRGSLAVCAAVSLLGLASGWLGA